MKRENISELMNNLMMRGLISLPARYSIVGWTAKDGQIESVTLALARYVVLEGEEARTAIRSATDE